MDLCSPRVSRVVVRRRLSSSCRRNSAPMGKVAKSFILGCFKCDVASFRLAGVALNHMWTCVVTCRKSFWVAGAILSRRFQKMSCFFVGGAALWTGPSSWQAQHFRRVVLRVFCASQWQGCAQWYNKVEIAWQAWQFVRCDEKFKASPCPWGKLQNLRLRRCH